MGDAILKGGAMAETIKLKMCLICNKQVPEDIFEKHFVSCRKNRLGIEQQKVNVQINKSGYIHENKHSTSNVNEQNENEAPKTDRIKYDENLATISVSTEKTGDSFTKLFHNKIIDLGEGLYMEMKYPSLDEFIRNNFDFNSDVDMDKSFELIASCIDKIYNEEEVWASSDVTPKEISEFLEGMNSSQFKQIEKFFETMPKLSHEVEVVNPNTKVKSKVVLEGLASFFA
jgi:hypothetical protein